MPQRALPRPDGAPPKAYAHPPNPALTIMTSSAETWTIGRLLQWTTDYLRERGVENPRLDTEVLLAHARGCERIHLYAAFEEVADDKVRAAFRELVQKRAAGVPVAYLVGHREFFSLSFAVTPAVLIPRPETELLVTAVLDLARNQNGGHSWQIADVGTGSGNIAVTLARFLPNSTITALDTAADALQIARENAQRHEVANRLQFVESDLLAAVPPEPALDFIVSNPPYVSTAEYERLPREVKEHEPRTALVAGAQGTEVIERLVEESVTRLRTGGWLLFEMSPMIANACRAMLEGNAQWSEVTIIPDLAGLDRVVQARRSEQTQS